MVKGPDDRYRGKVLSMNGDIVEVELVDPYRFRCKKNQEDHYKLVKLVRRASSMNGRNVGDEIIFSRRWLNEYVGNNFDFLKGREGYILNGLVRKSPSEDLDDKVLKVLNDTGRDEDVAPSPFELERTV